MQLSNKSLLQDIRNMTAEQDSKQPGKRRTFGSWFESDTYRSFSNLPSCLFLLSQLKGGPSAARGCSQKGRCSALHWLTGRCAPEQCLGKCSGSNVWANAQDPEHLPKH